MLHMSEWGKQVQAQGTITRHNVHLEISTSNVQEISLVNSWSCEHHIQKNKFKSHTFVLQ